MSFKLFRDASWLYPSRGVPAAWGVGAFLCLLAWSGAARAQTPEGTRITNVAAATYLEGNVSETITSNAVQVTVGGSSGQRGVVVEPDRTVTAAGGSTITLAHTVRNSGTLGDSFTVIAVSPGGWPIRIYLDLNGNGVLDEGEHEISGPIALGPHESASILLLLEVPGALTKGDTELITVSATSVTDSSVSDAANDTINGVTGEPGGDSLSIQKQVDLTEAERGGVLTYTILFEAAGPAPTLEAVITDSLPAWVEYEAGTLQIDGIPQTDAPDTDNGAFEPGSSPVVVFRLGTLQPGTTGVLKFQVRVQASAPIGSVLTNRAYGSYGVSGEKSAGPATATTTVIGPAGGQLDYKLTKRVIGPAVRTTGDLVTYRVVATNLLDSPIEGLHVLDTLPAVLDLVSASPMPANASGRVLSWSVNLRGLDSAVFLVDARVTASVPARTTALNTARAIIDTVVRADTASIFLEPGIAPRLEITLSAKVLEVAIGQTATLVATVTNPGPETLDDLVTDVGLPEGTRYVSGSLNGAELISVDGTSLAVRLPGSIDPTESRPFTYAIAIVNPPGSELLNRATATARSGSVVSNEATLILRLLTRMAAQTSVVFGKVWADLDGNGRQDEGEDGLANVDVWTEDGAVARTDDNGKFSFVNLRLGSHVFRPDPTTIPPGYMADPAEDGMARVRLTGWTSPRISLPLLPAPGVEALALRSAGRRKQTPSVSPQDTGVSVRTARQTSPMSRQIAQLAGGLSELARGDDADEAEIVSVAPAMSPEERRAERARAFLQGPGVEIVTPADGTVLASNRAFVIARAERDMPSTLMRGDSVLLEGVVRLDGLQEFPAIPLYIGPNLLTVTVRNSWGNLRSDKARVHVSGPVSSVVPETTRIVIPADGQTPAEVRVQLLDEWGVPVVNRPFLDVTFDGGTVVTPDASRASIGLQVQADALGWVVVKLKGGMTVGRSQLELKTGRTRTVVTVDMVARARPLMLIGTGQIGIGASSAGFGALSVRGRLTGTTALTVSYDTRRLDDGRDAFRRTTDPLSDGIYPILGDASSMRTMSAARGQLSAKVERGLDYVAFGDVQTGEIADDFTLARYARSITGASTRVSKGSLALSAFGASSSQSLNQIQLRGQGTSGPYSLGRRVIPGTQQVEVELRDRNNAQRVLSRTPLVPYIDYEIDPERGEIILKRALPAADGIGNPVFLVVTAESAGDGERKLLWGARLAGDLGHLSRSDRLEGITIGASVVRDGQALRPMGLVGADLRFAPSRAVDLAAEVAHSDAADSSGLATSLRGTVKLFNDGLTLAARWHHIGEGFGNPSNTALQGGTTDFAASAAVRLGRGEARLEHSRQEFSQLDIGRNRTQMSLRQSLTATTEIELRMAEDDVTGSDARALGLGEAKITWTPASKLKIWTEGRNRLYSRGSNTNVPGPSLGGGFSYQAMENVALEMRHMSMAASQGKEAYSLTNFGVRSQLAGGAQAWGSYQLTGGIEGARNAAVIGLNNSLRLTEAVTVSGMFERRMGVERATIDDPVRALPFTQLERDYWSAALGLEFLPQDRPYRFSIKGERKDGHEKSIMGRASGDVTLGESFGILSRQDFSSRETGMLSQGAMMKTDHRASLWGLVWRPRSTDKFNTLMELRWTQEERPAGTGALDRRGRDERLSAALEAIWSPSRRVEVGTRYAVRKSSSLVVELGLPELEQRSSASFLGSRLELNVARWLSLRGEARGMEERRSGARTWDVAPSLILHPIQGIELAAGRRWGPLNDPDFGVNGGKGWFMTIGARVTEATLPTATAFWRTRFSK